MHRLRHWVKPEAARGQMKLSEQAHHLAQCQTKATLLCRAQANVEVLLTDHDARSRQRGPGTTGT